MLNTINISPGKQKFIVYIVLTVVTLAVFWQVNQFDFISVDDNVYVTENSHLQSGITLDGIRWAFCTTYAEFWHPLTWLSLMFDYQLHGLNAGGYHVTNLILHIFSTLLLFWLFNRMTGEIWRSAFVAVVFALHPLHVQSVAWIAERKDVLSAFFWMLTLCLYVYYTEKPFIRRYLLVLFCFLCALISKSMTVTMPVVMILLDYWPLRRFRFKKGNFILWQLREKTLFFVLSATLSIIQPFMWNDSFEKGFPMSYRLANASVNFVSYIEKIIWPHNLTVLNYFSTQFPIWQTLGSSLLIIIISIGVIMTVKRLPYLFVGWLWFAITILPVLGIISYHIRWMHDHYTYLPSIGISIILAWGVPLFFPCSKIRKMILFPVGIAVLVIMAILSWQQCSYWKNSATLFSHAIEIKKNKNVAWEHFLIGKALLQERKIEEANEHFRLALKSEYHEAFSMKPDNILSYIDRGNAYAIHGQLEQAIKDYDEAIRLKPDYEMAYYNKCTLYNGAGQYQMAIENCSKAISLSPDLITAYINRGIAYSRLYRNQKAINDFSKAIRLKNNCADAYINRGLIYLNNGSNTLGCLDANKACEYGNCKLLEFAKGKGYCR